METDVYRTIEVASEGIYKEKGSRFISLAYPVMSEDEIRRIISCLKEEYYDARHRCYAWRLGVNEMYFRTNDDGEPSSTAGKPILGQIQSNALTNILIVVVRYFGGIKLGVSGLINAYREAAADAIANAKIIEKTIDDQLRIQFSYLAMNDVMKIVKEIAPDVLERNFEMACEMLLAIRQKDMPNLRNRLEQVDSLVFLDESNRKK